MANSADENPTPGTSLLEEDSDVIDLTEEVSSTARLPQAQADELDALGFDIPAFKMPSEATEDAEEEDDGATTQRLSADALQRANLADIIDSEERWQPPEEEAAAESEIDDLQDSDELDELDELDEVEGRDYDRQNLVKTMQMEAIDRSAFEALIDRRPEDVQAVLEDARFAPEVILAPPTVLVKRWREGLPGKVLTIVGASEVDMALEEAPATMPDLPSDIGPGEEEDDIDTAVVPEEVLPPPIEIQEGEDSEAILLEASELVEESDEEEVLELKEEVSRRPRADTPPPRPPAAKPPEAKPPEAKPPADDEMRGLVQELLEEKKEEREQPTKRLRPRDVWFQDVFSEEFLRTLPPNLGELTQRDADFIEASLKLKKGSRILDLACGFGRHSMELAQRGYEMVGLDLSMQLLQKALEDAQQRSIAVKFLHGDMRELNFAGVFDGCFIWDTSLGYFDDRTNLRVLQGVNRALKTGGRLVIEVVNRDYVIQQTPTRLWWEGDDCTFLEESEFDYGSSTLHAKRSFIYHDGTPPLEQNSFVRLYGAHELRQMLHVAGFKIMEISGERHHRGYFLGATSRKIIVLAEKRAKKKPGA